MTTIAAAREAITERFSTQWAAAQPAVPFTLENEAYTAPATSWVRMTIQNVDSFQETLGAVGRRRFIRRGSVFVQIFVATDAGVTPADTLARDARIIFEGVSFSGLRFNNAVIREVGPDGRFYQSLVEAFFEYDETK